MPGVSEIGAAKVNVDSYKCSIKKITASTKWKGPNSEMPETVESVLFDGQKPCEEKKFYIITSPEGKAVTIKIEREDGKCKRDAHKKYQKMWDEFEVDESQNYSLVSPNNGKVILRLPFHPYILKQSSKKDEGTIQSSEEFKIKCFEIGGAKEAFRYFKLPVPADEKCISTFNYLSCNEGTIQYKIVSYPDISFSLAISIGTYAKKNINKTSKFEKNTKYYNTIPAKLSTLNNEALNTKLRYSPSLELTTKYNNDKDEIKLSLQLDGDKDYGHFSYKHNDSEEEYGTGLLQELLKGTSDTLDKLIDLFSLIGGVCSVDFLKELMQYDASNLVDNYKPYKIKLDAPSVSFSCEGKYQNSKDLTRIGRFVDLGLDCEPLLGISLTVDLLFLILTATTSGAATGFYVMLKNLDKVIGSILGSSYKKKYKDTNPFEADVYFNFIVKGSVNGHIHWITDTTEEKDDKSSSQSIEGKLQVNLDAGAKCSVDFFYLQVEGEVSASGTSGIKIIIGMENHIAQGKGFLFLIEAFFMGLKVKYCVKGKVGLYNTKSYGKNLFDDEAKLMDMKTLFSKRYTVLAD